MSAMPPTSWQPSHAATKSSWSASNSMRPGASGVLPPPPSSAPPVDETSPP